MMLSGRPRALGRTRRYGLPVSDDNGAHQHDGSDTSNGSMKTFFNACRFATRFDVVALRFRSDGAFGWIDVVSAGSATATRIGGGGMSNLNRNDASAKKGEAQFESGCRCNSKGNDAPGYM